MRSEKSSSGKRRAYKGKFRERFISRWQGSIVSRRAEASKKSLLFASRVGAYVMRRACISSAHLISACVDHYSFSPSLSIQSRSFSCVSHSRHIRSIALYVRRHRVRQRSLVYQVYSIKNEFSSPIFFLVALGYTLCICSCETVFQKSHTDDDCDILV